MSKVSVREVAALAGVSIGTVSNVLNHPDKVASETNVKVHAAIDQLGFIRNDAARQLRAGVSRAIGLVILDVVNPFFTDLARGAQDRAAAAGMSIILGYSDERPERERAYLDLFEEQRVHGVLLSPAGDPAPRLIRLRERGIPAVLVDRVSADTSFSSVSVDDVVGGSLATEHLLSRGRGQIAFVGGPFSIRQVADRFEGASHAVARTPHARLEVISVTGLTVAEGRRVGRAVAQRPASERPTGLFAANDLLALGVLEGLLLEGDVRVPEDISIIGYDDIGFAAGAMISLSSIRQPTALIGQTAVDLLLSEADHHAAAQSIIFQPALVVRDSS